ncbi:hypothetical protein CVT26_006192 [Gymnopilus dilepis]|uniref:Uncharacterized protein n=1 Tax=Gymnopilus dilepis TaxID=231916 RepID=A0A409VPS0_9AGAR|nr:hypothetical protein CVT26_006192 [Gymnopilus dilepis]
MDRLERDIYENYIDNRSPTYSRNTGPRLHSSVPRHYLETTGPFQSPVPSPYPQAVFSMNRSGSDNRSSEFSTAPWPDRVNSYRQGRSYHGYSVPSGHFDAQYGRQGMDIEDIANSSPPASERRAMRNSSPQMSFNYPSHHNSPALSSATSSYRDSRISQGPVQCSDARYSQAEEPAFLNRSSRNEHLSPSQTQLVRYEVNHGLAPKIDQSYTRRHGIDYATLPDNFTSGWSMATTRDSDSEDLSIDSLQHSQSDHYSQYTDTTSRSSDYVESYDVDSREEYDHEDYLDHDDGLDTNPEFMSGEVASDEGAYDFPGEVPGYDYDGHESYSDGYSSSFSEGDDGYGDSE